MQIDTAFCNKVMEEYKKTLETKNITPGYEDMWIHDAQVALDVFKICFELLQQQQNQNP